MVGFSINFTGLSDCSDGSDESDALCKGENIQKSYILIFLACHLAFGVFSYGKYGVLIHIINNLFFLFISLSVCIQLCLYKKGKHETSYQKEMPAINGSLIEETNHSVNVELVSVLEKDHNFAQTSCRISCYYDEVSCKDTLKKIYEYYHSLKRQRAYYEHVKDVTVDLNMIEIAIDEAWTIGKPIWTSS